MIQIGAQMIGRNVVCPQCGNRLTVPPQSVPQAEALYQFLKQKRIAEKNNVAKSPQKTKPKPEKTEKQKTSVPISQPSSSPLSTSEKTVAPISYKKNIQLEPVQSENDTDEQDASFTDFEADEIDHWIAEFWAMQPQPDNNSIETNWTISQSLPSKNETKSLDVAASNVQTQLTLTLLRTWLIVVFLFGFVGGLCTYSFFAGVRKGTSGVVDTIKSELASENSITGKLYYRGFDGEQIPDADAVVLFLPLERIPTIPLSVEGIRPGDTQSDSINDATQQIDEIGGLFLRTGANGGFEIPYKKQGHYLALLISSHAKRSEPELDLATRRKLQRFFRTPQNLIGDFQFICEEYEFEQGKYILRETF
jgi:hypothetical protein